MLNVTVRLVYRAEYEITLYDVDSVESALEQAQNMSLYNARSIYAHDYIDESQQHMELVQVEEL